MVDYTNPSNYKPCVKKSFDAYACIPGEGVVVLSSMARHLYKTSKMFYKNTFIVDEFCNRHEGLNCAKGEEQLIQLALNQGQAYKTTAQQPVVLYDPAAEDYQVLPLGALAQMFCFLVNNQPAHITPQLLKERSLGDTLDWTLVRSSPAMLQGKFCACHIPTNQIFAMNFVNGYHEVNKDPKTRGRGDFIVCPMLPNGMPNLQAPEYVSGRSFAYTYNNKGWTDVLDPREPSICIEDLPQVFLKDNSALTKAITAAGKNYGGTTDFRVFKNYIDDIKPRVDKVIFKSPTLVYLGLKHATMSGKNIMTLTAKEDKYHRIVKVLVNVELANGKTLSTECSMHEIPQQVENFRKASGHSCKEMSAYDKFKQQLEFCKQFCDEARILSDNDKVITAKCMSVSRGGSDYDDNELYIKMDKATKEVYFTFEAMNTFTYRYEQETEKGTVDQISDYARRYAHN